MQRLAQILRTKRAAILEDWHRAVVADVQVPVASTLSAPALRDHVPEILDAIIEALERGLDGAEASSGRELAERKMPRAHAIERFAQGYSLAAMMREISHLRAALIASYWDEAHFDARGVQFLHAVLDECSAIAAVQLERAAAAQLRAERESLREAVEVREHFVAVLSHDLRNPLNTIKMANGLLATATDASPPQKELIARSTRAVDRMRTMIEEILDFTKVRSGALVLERTPVDLARLSGDLVEELRGAHPDRVVRARMTGALEGQWDGVRLAQVVSNLLSNALAYGAPRTPVDLEVAAEADSVVIRVHNEGAPIPKESQEKIFDAFHRGDGESSNPNGIGLGLYIASEIVRAHGGTIGVESEEGRGTTFTVRLPRVHS